MIEEFSKALGKQLGTLSPYMVTFLVALVLILKFGPDFLRSWRDATAPRAFVGPIQNGTDALVVHDTFKIVERIEAFEREETAVLQQVVAAQQRMADILDRLERRIEARA